MQHRRALVITSHQIFYRSMFHLSVVVISRSREEFATAIENLDKFKLYKACSTLAFGNWTNFDEKQAKQGDVLQTWGRLRRRLDVSPASNDASR